MVTLPFSLCLVIKVVQEYEKTVIFRLGRILSGGARGPGVFFVIPCVDIFQVIDMRVQNFSVPPQEVVILTRPSPSAFKIALIVLPIFVAL